MEMIIFSLVVLIMEATCETAEQYKELILKKHNGYRREQGGSNINKLVTQYCKLGCVVLRERAKSICRLLMYMAYSREFLTQQMRILMLFARIKFSRKIPN